MEIRQIRENKKTFLPLLLLADEQESMIDRYLEQGDLWVLYDPDPVGLYVVIQGEWANTMELKALAVAPERQRQGLGRMLVEHLLNQYQGKGTLLVGTGDTPLTLSFYESLGFVFYARSKDFFLKYYDHPIFEGGRQLVDMVSLQHPL